MDSIVDDVEKVARQCAQNTSIDFEKVANCTNSRMGNQLQHVYAIETEHTKPTQAFVPWVTLNGNHTEKIQDLAETDLIALICDTYKVKMSCLFIILCRGICFLSYLGCKSTSSM